MGVVRNALTRSRPAVEDKHRTFGKSHQVVSREQRVKDNRDRNGERADQCPQRSRAQVEDRRRLCSFIHRRHYSQALADPVNRPSELRFGSWRQRSSMIPGVRGPAGVSAAGKADTKQNAPGSRDVLL
jgi:hypothetical protein